jgi:dTDP-4-amino-4,6-dideoxygalactose transaminase
MSGEGGVITTDNPEYITAIKQFRQHGMTAQYEYVDLGYNYRMSDLHAAIAVEQLKKAHRFTEARRANAKRLSDGLSGVKGLVLPVVAAGRTHVYNQYTVRVTKDFPVTRDFLVAQLKKNEISPGIYYPEGLHETPHLKYLGYKTGDFPVTQQATKEVLSLPVHPKVTPTDIAKIVAVVKEAARG